jgi:CBS domain-containing protein
VAEDELGIAEVVNAAPATTSPDRPVEEVALELVGRGLSGMPVLDGEGALVGVVSEYDLIARRGRTVGEIMSHGVITATEEASVAEVVRLMGLHGIRLVPIVRDGRLVGVVSRTDLIRRFVATRWRCPTCGAAEYGLERPERCATCGANGADLILERMDG